MNEIKKADNMEVLMGRDEALELTDAIKSTTSALYSLLKRAHSQGAWVALGYKSWKDYVETEFEISRQRSYQLIAQADTIEALSEAAGTDVYISEKEARAIKKSLPKITERIEKAVEEGDDRESVVQEAIHAEMEAEYAEERTVDLPTDESEVWEDYDDGAPRGVVPGNDTVEMDEDTARESAISNNVVAAEFYTENLERTLNVFDSLPSTDAMVDAIERTGADKEKFRYNIKKANKWLEALLDRI